MHILCQSDHTPQLLSSVRFDLFQFQHRYDWIANFYLSLITSTCINASEKETVSVFYTDMIATGMSAQSKLGRIRSYYVRLGSPSLCLHTVASSSYPRLAVSI